MKSDQESYLNTYAITDPGSIGRVNEDRYEISSIELEDDPTPILLAIVADGVGGHQAGEIASQLAVDAIVSVVKEGDMTQPLWTLKSALLEANHTITSHAEKDETKKGMGSTTTCALIIDYHLFIASMGDSRIYLLRDGRIRQLTVDHTWVQEAIENGVISPQEARDHPRRNLIRSYLGTSDPIRPDLRMYLEDSETPEQAEANQGLPLIPQDVILLCSDGLTSLVTDDEILTTLEKMADKNQALEKLVELSNNRGGHDNITIVALQVPGEELFLT
ncbi:MAG: PP2C family serine/threonine-protein phosphatase [Anaerolineales bacterium]